MTLPQILPIPQEPATISYSWTDVASGEGYVTFYGYKDNGSNYGLTNNVIYSDATGWEGNNFSQDFDSTEFNHPRYIRGVVIANIPLGVYNNGGTTSSYPSIDVIHYDGSTETSLGTATASANPISVSSDEDFKYFTLEVDVAGKLFRKGDLLRITVTVTNTTGTGGSWATKLGFDPKDREGDFHSVGIAIPNTQLAFYVPFRIDL